jgi:putative membrane protein
MRKTLLAGIAFVTGMAFAQAPGSMGQPSRPMPGTNPINQPGMPNDTRQIKMKADDKEFVQDAAMGGMAEVAMGKLAAEKGSSDAVKQYGQKMVDDHTKANDELKQVASAQSMTIPDALDSRHQSRIDKLSKLSGAAFDKAYAKAQVKDHEEDVRAFQDEAQNGNNAAVKDFANKALPTLREHLTMAKDLSKGKMASNSADRSQ